MTIRLGEATINGTTGTTAVSLTATGTSGSQYFCATDGAWQGAPNTTTG